MIICGDTALHNLIFLKKIYAPDSNVEMLDDFIIDYSGLDLAVVFGAVVQFFSVGLNHNIYAFRNISFGISHKSNLIRKTFAKKTTVVVEFGHSIFANLPV